MPDSEIKDLRRLWSASVKQSDIVNTLANLRAVPLASTLFGPVAVDLQDGLTAS